MRDFENFQCPTCGRLTSVPWKAAWCTHGGSTFTPNPPNHESTGWVRMVPVASVVPGVLPEGHDEWVVMEQRNPYGYPDNKLPEGACRLRIVSVPMPREEAYAQARRQPTDPGIADHCHWFSAVPRDLAWEER